MVAGYTVNKTLTFVAVLSGMFAGSAAINKWLKPDLSIPDLLAEPDSDPKVQKQKRIDELLRQHEEQKAAASKTQ
ncbi:hypothetical protein DFJ77DRAFT_363981 [Powellomyces hirtus]|nr:hypothetical protein DFJ77DRAFT_363981 [Powellomyces hirtus]